MQAKVYRRGLSLNPRLWSINCWRSPGNTTMAGEFTPEHRRVLNSANHISCWRSPDNTTMANEFTPERRRVLNSGNHTEREKMLDECKRKFDTARDEFLASKGISEEELLKFGYSKKTWTSSTESPFRRDWRFTLPSDDYPVYLSPTGNKNMQFYLHIRYL